MFVVLETVPIRTLPTPTNGIEITVESGLKTLRAGVIAFRSVIGIREPESLASLGSDVEEASRSLRGRWARLDLLSPYRAVADEVIEILSESMDMLSPEATPTGVVHELAEWMRAQASCAAARRISAAIAQLGITLREASRRSSIAPGHLSELLDGNRSLPTVSTAQRLDATLGTDLVAFVVSARGPIARLGRRRRRPKQAAVTPPWPNAAVDPRLDALIARLAGDDRLIQFNEDLLNLSPSLRRAIAQMVRLLATENHRNGVR